jgi:pimeloyl-ACP methyl ester carboxylesterase
VLLHTAKLPPPYILVGHSAGGLYVQMFARLYPKEVSGIVFVDSANTEQIFGNGLPLPEKNNPVYGEALGFIESLQQVKNAPHFPKVPIIVLTATRHGHHPDLSSKYPVVLNNGKTAFLTGTEIENLLAQWQDHLSKLSPDSIHVYAYGSGHHIQEDQPNLVIDAIYTLTKKLRSDRQTSAYKVLVKKSVNFDRLIITILTVIYYISKA